MTVKKEENTFSFQLTSGLAIHTPACSEHSSNGLTSDTHIHSLQSTAFLELYNLDTGPAGRVISILGKEEVSSQQDQP